MKRITGFFFLALAGPFNGAGALITFDPARGMEFFRLRIEE